MLRFLFGLLIGAIIGAVGTTYFFSTGGGDHLVATSPRVLHLEEDLRRVTQEREQIAKKLEDTAALVDKLTTKFSDLEHRFQTLEGAAHKSTTEGTHEGQHGETPGPPS
ncbi:MAG TPA: hypothetical protein VGX03_27765 [Candidatus Binatia bacterium]|nr:hypothetical protein [Candidatus Binatia bacterium]